MKWNFLNIIIKIFMLLVFVNVTGCSVQNKLNKTYEGKNEEFLIGKMGKPAMAYQIGKGKKVDVYEKKTMLKKAPINTGHFQYDRFDSPQATKVETFKFLIGGNGKIENVQYEYRYER